MPQVSQILIKKRAKLLREIGKINLNNYLKKQIGLKKKVLVEKVVNNISVGKSQHFTNVEIRKKLIQGSIVNCIITDVIKETSKATPTT